MNRMFHRIVVIAGLLLTTGRPVHGGPPNNDVSDERNA